MILTPLAVSHADVLRLIQKGPPASHDTVQVDQIAKGTGRTASNVRRDLPKLEAAGLVALQHPDNPLASFVILGLTSEGEEAVAALDRAEGKASAAALAEGFAALLHGQIEPDPLNPRKDFDEGAIAELAASIAQDGLLENLVVRRVEPAEPGERPAYRLVAGERRWRAIGHLIEFVRADDGEPAWPSDRPIACKVVDIDDATHRRLALVENLQRKDLKPLEEARALDELMKVTGVGTAEIAAEIGFTQRWAQQRLQLLKLPANKQRELDAGKITIEEARRWLANQPTLADMPPATWLMLGEIYDRSARENDGHGFGHVEVAPDDRAAAAIKALPGSWVYASSIWDAGFDTGRRKVNLYSWGGGVQLDLKFGDALKTDDARQAALNALRAEIGESPLPSGVYTAEWLNGPFEVDPEIQRQIEDAKAQRDQQQEAQRRAQAEAVKRHIAALERTRALEAAQRAEPTARIAAAFEPAFSDAGFQLPVQVGRDGAIVDARGRLIVQSEYYGSDHPGYQARRALIALAINATAGIATPEPETPADEDALGRPAFIAAVANCLLEDCADLPEDEDEAEAEAHRRAEAGLVAFLAKGDLEYGADGHDWAEDGAMALAQAIREEGLGQDAAIEGQDEELPGDAHPGEQASGVDADGLEISPALARLAGAQTAVA